MAAWCYVVRKVNGWMGDNFVQEVTETRRLARRATELGRDDAVALCWGGYALSYVAGDVDDGRAYIDQALALNPNLAAAWNFSGWIRIMLGEHQSAIDRFERALRLSPRDPTVFHMRTGIAYANLFAGHYEIASSAARDALRDRTWLGGLRILAASKAFVGQLEEAREVMSRIRQLDPALRISNLKDRISPLQPEDFAKYADGLRNAGLPE